MYRLDAIPAAPKQKLVNNSLRKVQISWLIIINIIITIIFFTLKPHRSWFALLLPEPEYPAEEHRSRNNAGREVKRLRGAAIPPSGLRSSGSGRDSVAGAPRCRAHCCVPAGSVHAHRGSAHRWNYGGALRCHKIAIGGCVHFWAGSKSLFSLLSVV